MIEDMERAWERLGRTLGGTFAARSRGVVSPELVLLTADDRPFGRLTPARDGGALLRAEDLEARIGPPTDGRYTMTSGGRELLVAEPAGSETVLTLRSGDRSFGARLSLLRGDAVALSAGGGETARVSGNLTNRRYEATFAPEDPDSLPIAVFLLNHAFTLRRNAFLAGR